MRDERHLFGEATKRQLHHHQYATGNQRSDVDHAARMEALVVIRKRWKEHDLPELEGRAHRAMLDFLRLGQKAWKRWHSAELDLRSCLVAIDEAPEAESEPEAVIEAMQRRRSRISARQVRRLAIA